MKFFTVGKILKNQKGISPVESLIAIGLFGAVAVIGLKQSEFMGQSSNDLRLERDMVDLHSGLDGLVKDPATCEANFIGKQVPSHLTSLIGPDGNILFSTSGDGPNGTGQSMPGGGAGLPEQPTYLNGKIKINQMRLQFESEVPVLRIEFEKLSDSSMAKFSKSIELMVDLNEQNIIESCYNLEASMDDTLKYLVAKKLCEKTYGENTAEFYAHFHTNPEQTEASCSFNGFPSNIFTQCPQGQAITSIQFDPSANQFTPTCSSPINSQLCPSGWIRSVDNEGNLGCNDLGNHINTSQTVINTPTQCRLMSSGSSSTIQLLCDGGTPPEEPSVCDCSSGLQPDPAAICSGQTQTYPDSCGTPGQCSVTGTKNCSPSPGMGVYSCGMTGWNFQTAQYCETSSSYCSNSGLSASPGQSVCCSSAPLSQCGSAPPEDLCQSYSWPNYSSGDLKACCPTGTPSSYTFEQSDEMSESTKKYQCSKQPVTGEGTMYPYLCQEYFGTVGSAMPPTACLMQAF